MSRPRFIDGVGLALVLSVAAAVAFAVLAPFIAAGTLLRATIALLGLIYVVYLLNRSGERNGRVTTVLAWCIVTAAAWLFASLPLYLLIQVGMIWLVRSLYYYSSITSALMDLGLSAFGLAAAAWAVGRSGSLLLALWCYFLVQALFSAIPASLRRVPADARTAEPAPFERAQRNAEAALRRLSTH